MKVLKDGKEVKATVAYDQKGNPMYVTEDGVNYDVSAYELQEDEPVKKTADVSKSDKKAVKTTDAPVKTEEPKKNDSVLTTEDVSTRKK